MGRVMIYVVRPTIGARALQDELARRVSTWAGAADAAKVDAEAAKAKAKARREAQQNFWISMFLRKFD
jgi:hypothetical protein